MVKITKEKSNSPPKIGKKLQDYIDRNPGRMTNKIFKLARSRKPTGRLNLDDFYNVRDSGVLAGTGFPLNYGKKTTGPAGKVMKKRSGGKLPKKR